MRFGRHSAPITTKPSIFPSFPLEIKVRVDEAQHPQLAGVSVIIINGSDAQYACCFHTYCGQYLIGELKQPEDIHRLYSLIHSLTPLYSPPKWILQAASSVFAEALDHLTGQSHLLCNQHRSPNPRDNTHLSSLSTLLLDIRRKLPIEFLNAIWSFLPLCPLRSFLFVAGETSRDFKQTALLNEPYQTSAAVLGHHISLSLTRVMNTEYICGLHDGVRLHGYASRARRIVELPPSIQLIKFTVGMYGVKVCSSLRTGVVNFSGKRSPKGGGLSGMSPVPGSATFVQRRQLGVFSFSGT